MPRLGLAKLGLGLATEQQRITSQLEHIDQRLSAAKIEDDVLNRIQVLDDGEVKTELGAPFDTLLSGLSQEAPAQVLGVHRIYMGGVERGERNLTLRSLERIAERLKLEPLDLLR